jgi:hypothetical protein
MGKATILEDLGQGKYLAAIDYGSEIIDARVERIQKQIDQRRERLLEIEPELQEAQAEVNTLTAAVDEAIADYRFAIGQGEAADTGGIVAANKALIEAAGRRDVLAQERLELTAIVTSLEADKAQLRSVRVEETRELWCADYTLGASGEVATVEVPGEPQDIVIVPEARAWTKDDGRLIARGAQVGHQCYFNAAILPGWQKWKPTFRKATITEISPEGRANLVLEGTSSAQDLPVNQSDELFDVEIEYMSCNAAAFEPDDEVLVDMRGESPKVIGFIKDPRPCCWWPQSDALVPPALLYHEVELQQSGRILYMKWFENEKVSLFKFDRFDLFISTLSTIGLATYDQERSAFMFEDSFPIGVNDTVVSSIASKSQVVNVGPIVSPPDPVSYPPGKVRSQGLSGFRSAIFRQRIDAGDIMPSGIRIVVILTGPDGARAQMLLQESPGQLGEWVEAAGELIVVSGPIPEFWEVERAELMLISVLTGTARCRWFVRCIQPIYD